MSKMTSDEYSRFRSAIETANNHRDKEALRLIQMQLIAKYGLDCQDVMSLLKKFRYSV